MARRGQTAVEYILLVVVAASAFTFLFGAIRRGLFKLWVCEMGPRVQTLASCGQDTAKCINAKRSPEVIYEPTCTLFLNQ